MRNDNTKLRKVIAIDFDGCICSADFPYIGEPDLEVIEEARKQQEQGAALVLWTCRTGERLDEAVRACKLWGLNFDAVNENLPERIEFFGGDCRKVSADEYWDDKAKNPCSDIPDYENDSAG